MTKQQVTFGSYKPRNTNTVKKLSLDAEEQVRVSFVEPAPTMVFVHNFEKIVTDSDGNPIVVHGTWPDGRPRESFKAEYAGKFACLGDFETVDAAGVDPENCEACRAAVDNPNAFKKPTRRFLGHVVKYSTKPGGWSLSNPFSASLIVWDLTEKRFNEINDIYEEHGDLKKVDLLLGPCTNAKMQQYTIKAGSGKAKWMETEDNIKYITTLLDNERVEDLAAVAAKKPLPYEMKQKVTEVSRAYNDAFNVEEESYESLIGDNSSDEAEEAPVRKRMSVTPPSNKPADEDEETVDESIVDDSDESDDEDEGDVTPLLEELLGHWGK